MPMSAMKARNFKLPSVARFINKEGWDDFRNQNPFSIQKDFQNPSIPHVSYPSPKD